MITELYIKSVSTFSPNFGYIVIYLACKVDNTKLLSIQCSLPVRQHK